jgi:dolichol kinase
MFEITQDVANATPLALALSTGYLLVMVALEAAKRKFGFSPEITRRFVHIWSGLYTILDFMLLPSFWFLILIAISLGGIALSQWFGWLTSVHKVKRRTFGEVFLPMGSLATWAISQGDPKVFIPSLLIMTFADSLAGITSDLLKQPRKIWRGSVVFFAVTAIILGLGTQLDLLRAFIMAAALTAVERFSPLGSDNATVPVGAALFLLTL